MDKYLSISQMAELHNLSRQALIYYDKIELFKPTHIDENGYRLYSAYQIPILREICFLKSIGIKLERIKEHIKNRNIVTALSLLKSHEEFVEKEINRLKLTRDFIKERLEGYSNANQFKDELDKPTIESLPERKVVFIPFANEICREELYFTQMKIRNIFNRYGILPAKGFGTIIKKNNLYKEDIFKGAGGYVNLSYDENNIESTITIPSGKYVCMYKYGMPYDTEYLHMLLRWIHDNNYRVAGDIVDECLLDTTFYDGSNKVDFCQLQIPIEEN